MRSIKSALLVILFIACAACSGGGGDSVIIEDVKPSPSDKLFDIWSFETILKNTNCIATAELGNGKNEYLISLIEPNSCSVSDRLADGTILTSEIAVFSLVNAACEASGEKLKFSWSSSVNGDGYNAEEMVAGDFVLSGTDSLKGEITVIYKCEDNCPDNYNNCSYLFEMIGSRGRTIAEEQGGGPEVQQETPAEIVAETDDRPKPEENVSAKEENNSDDSGAIDEDSDEGPHVFAAGSGVIDSPPVIINPISDVVVDTMLPQTILIDMTDVFADENGDDIVLNYEVVSAVSGTSFPLFELNRKENNVLELKTFYQSGSGEISVTATANGKSVSDNFSIVIGDYIAADIAVPAVPDDYHNCPPNYKKVDNRSYGTPEDPDGDIKADLCWSDNYEVKIPDSSLRNKIMTLLGVVSESNVTSAALSTITTMNLNYAAGGQIINDLKGAEFCTGLRDISFNKNRVVSLEPLSDMPNLIEINADENLITSDGISYLNNANLASINRISLYKNKITAVPDLSNIAGTLTELDVGWQDISSSLNIENLSGLHGLQVLNLRLDRLESPQLASIAGLVNLQKLYLTSNKLTNIDSLNLLTKLTELNLAYNRNLTNISSVELMTEMQTLYLGGCTIGNLGVNHIRNLNKLVNLSTSDNGISDIGPLNGLTGITILDISGNPVTNISSISGMNLRILYMNNSRVTDLSALSGMTELVTLGISNADNSVVIENLSPLGSCCVQPYPQTKLVTMWMQATAVRDDTAGANRIIVTNLKNKLKTGPSIITPVWIH